MRGLIFLFFRFKLPAREKNRLKEAGEGGRIKEGDIRVSTTCSRDLVLKQGREPERKKSYFYKESKRVGREVLFFIEVELRKLER